jgi:hypothetical protein
MPAAQYLLRKVQFGFESTAGTAVPASKALVADCVYVPEVDRARPSFERGFRALTTDGGVETRRGSSLRVETDLDCEQIMLFLDSGLGGRVTTGAGPFTHTYDPALSSAPAPRAATFEVAMDDGATKQYQREFAFGTTRRIGIDLQRGQTARLLAEVFGRAEQPRTPTSGLSALARTTLKTSDFKYYFDSSWAALGTTEKVIGLRSGYLDLTWGTQPAYAFDGRADLDFTHLLWGELTGRLMLTIEHDQHAALEVDAWRARTRRFIRLAGTSGTKAVRLDVTGFYAAPPVFSRRDDTEVVSLSLELDLDPVSSEVFRAVDSSVGQEE